MLQMPWADQITTHSTHVHAILTPNTRTTDLYLTLINNKSCFWVEEKAVQFLLKYKKKSEKPLTRNKKTRYFLQRTTKMTRRAARTRVVRTRAARTRTRTTAMTSSRTRRTILQRTLKTSIKLRTSKGQRTKEMILKTRPWNQGWK